MSYTSFFVNESRYMMIRLNVGCGDDIRESWTNIDVREKPGITVMDVRDIHSAYGDCAVDEIRAIDVLEHIPWNETGILLASWCSTLKPGGKLTLHVPDMAALAHMLLDSDEDEKSVIRSIYGGQDYEENTHRSGWTPGGIKMELLQAGFSDATVDCRGRHMYVFAVKGE